MKKRSLLYLLCLLCLMAALCGCGQQSGEREIYFSPRQRQSVSMLDGKLVFCINDSLYSAQEKDGKLVLEKAGGENGTVGYLTRIYPGENEDSIYLIRDETMTVEKLSKSYERTQVCEIPEDRTQTYTFGLITDGNCYCIKPRMDNQSTGQDLIMFSLKEGSERTTVHAWDDSYFVDVFPPTAPEIHSCGQYLVITYPHIEGEPLWVYDTKEGKMVVSGDAAMSYAACVQDKLYFLEDDTGSIRTYDLTQKSLLEGSIPVKDYVPGATLSCDADYLYVSRVTQNDWPQENSSETLVYNYEGELVDTIDMKENGDAQALAISDNPVFCGLMCSTKDYVFWGSSMADTYGIFYVEKSQLGSGNATIYTLYKAE